MKYASLSTDGLLTWARLNDIELHGVSVESHLVDQDGNDKGGGLVATQDLQEGDILISVPNNLLLSKELVNETTKFDRDLREVMQAVGSEFIQDARIAISIFLIIQFTNACSEAQSPRVGVTTALTDYVRFLPKSVTLPTFYEEEMNLLQGTSLATALNQKISRLQTEFDHLRRSTEKIKWCEDVWWSEDHGILTFEDWKLADALYRSRAFETPRSSSHCMAPLLDMVNHSSRHNAGYQFDEHDDSLLLVCRDISIKKGEEVTITYGSGGACESIFSYGFLEKNAHSARELYVSFNIPDDDPLKRAKLEFAKTAPGIRIFVNEKDQSQWESSLVWWSCANEEDGLNFAFLQENNGSTELNATWKGDELGADNLQKKLLADPQRDIFSLRATVSVQNQVEKQGIELSTGQEAFDAGIAAGLRGPTVDTIRRLRDLEMTLLASSYEALEDEKARLLNSETVREYLNAQHNSDRAKGAEEEDFS